MLSRNLKKIKVEIESKASTYRSEDEERLLEELYAIDSNIEIRKAIIDDDIIRIPAGPGNNCPCCGRVYEYL